MTVLCYFHKMLMLLSFLLFRCVLSQSDEFSINTVTDVSDFVDFANNVNRGTNYKGVSVLLEADIEFTAEESNQFKPIGNEANSFRGVFDGQGHAIKNLNVNSSFQYVGLFGYSNGTTIKNVVIGESCSFSSYGYGSYVGGVIGHCNTINGRCILENTVNMASVTFSGNVNVNIYIGGIVGLFYLSTERNLFIRNCVNYGPITCTGYSGRYSFIGGIVGEYHGRSVENCINYGTISINRTSEKGAIIIGGIAGKTWNTIIENCLSAGKIVSNTGAIGSIVGGVGNEWITNITHSFWTNETGYTKSSGGGTYSTENSYHTELNSDAMEKMNEYASKVDPSCSWIVLHMNGGKFNNGIPSYKELIVTQKHFPDPVNDGHTFQFWCTNPGCTEKYDPSMTGVTDLYAAFVINNYTVTFMSDEEVIQSGELPYGSNIPYPINPTKKGHSFVKWDSNPITVPDNAITITAIFIINNYTVTFMSDEEVIQNKSLAYGTNIPYPINPTKKDHSFVKWDSNPITVPDNDITITAIFIINNYTVTFDFDNGTVIEKEYQYNARIEYPKNVDRKGYLFLGWDNTTFEFMPDHNVITKALWNETTQFVEIVFGTKDMSKKEIENAIKEYVDDDIEFVIERFEVDKDTGETTVVIKFIDREKASEFVRIVQEAREARSLIKRMNFVSNDYSSFSTALWHSSAFIALLN